MHASAFTDVGVVADVNVIRRVEEQRLHNRSTRTTDPREAMYGEGLSAAVGGFGPPVYECEGTTRHFHQKRFHYMDIVPFGFRSPTEVFSVVGRHTNHGLVMGRTPKGGFYILPYRTAHSALTQERLMDAGTALASPSGLASLCVGLGGRGSRVSPFPPARAPVLPSVLASSFNGGPLSVGIQPPRRPSLSQAPRQPYRRQVAPQDEVTESLRVFFGAAETLKRQSEMGDADPYAQSVDSSAAGSSVGPSRMPPSLQCCLEERELWELALPAALTRTRKTPAVSAPHRVRSRVMARRFGYAGAPLPARVVAAQYDISYTLKYDCDGGVDVGVLHNDIYLVDDSEADPCGVRDVVTLTLQRLERAVIVEARADGSYRALLLSDPTRTVIDVRLAQVAHVVPLLKDALWSDPSVVSSFRAMDPNQTGFVKWKDVRNLIMHSENYGLPLSFLQMGELQRELRVRTGRVEPKLSWMAAVQEEEMLLDFREFEYVVTRVKNMM